MESYRMVTRIKACYNAFFSETYTRIDKQPPFMGSWTMNKPVREALLKKEI